MVIDFAAEINDLDGSPVAKPDNKGAATLGWLATFALQTQFEDEQNLDVQEKLRRFKLAVKIHDVAELELNVEDIALLKKLIGKAYGVVIVGRAYALLDPSE